MANTFSSSSTPGMTSPSSVLATKARSPSLATRAATSRMKAVVLSALFCATTRPSIAMDSLSGGTSGPLRALKSR